MGGNACCMSKHSATAISASILIKVKPVMVNEQMIKDFLDMIAKKVKENELDMAQRVARKFLNTRK